MKEYYAGYTIEFRTPLETERDKQWRLFVEQERKDAFWGGIFFALFIMLVLACLK